MNCAPAQHCKPTFKGAIISGFAALSCLVATGIFPGLAEAAGEVGANACPTHHNVPEDIAARLDSTLRTVIDGTAESADLLGYAPGAELFVRSPVWTYHRALGKDFYCTIKFESLQIILHL